MVHGIAQVLEDEADGFHGLAVCHIALHDRRVGLNGVGQHVEAGAGRQFVGHADDELGVDNGHVGRERVVGDGILDAGLLIGDDGEWRHLAARA